MRSPKRISRIPLTLLFVLMCPQFSPAVLACSTFLLQGPNKLVVGHNLDQEFHTPGCILINPRGTERQSVNGEDLGLTEFGTPQLRWKSRYGSATFSYLGIGFPDAGINEAGLVVNEMALGDSQFPFDPRKPTLFIHQWIQYQLDNFSTVDEVIRHLGDTNIDPRATFTPVSWANYHFFVADSGGNSAAIDLVGGRPIVHSGPDLSVPVLGNRPYQEELQRYQRWTGLTGWFRRWLESDTDQRWMIGATGLEDYDPESGDTVNFAFDLLSRMQFDHTRQWSVVYDVSNLKVDFRTAAAPAIKSLALKDLDFSASSPPRILGRLDRAEPGDISGRLEPFDASLNRGVIERFLRSLIGFVSRRESDEGMDQYLLEAHNMTLDEFIDRAQGMSLSSTLLSTLE